MATTTPLSLKPLPENIQDPEEVIHIECIIIIGNVLKLSRPQSIDRYIHILIMQDGFKVKYIT
ncbi:hypothetical protein Csa_021216 [Cucumis sativus]|nr:hypothetical protein Csa_021216 [Cucumis sativus]